MRVGDTEIVVYEDPWMPPDTILMLTDEWVAVLWARLVIRIWWGQ